VPVQVHEGVLDQVFGSLGGVDEHTSQAHHVGEGPQVQVSEGGHARLDDGPTSKAVIGTGRRDLG
jgi:hypothetical protein